MKLRVDMNRTRNLRLGVLFHFTENIGLSFLFSVIRQKCNTRKYEFYNETSCLEKGL